jgi:hypothetical protein
MRLVLRYLPLRDGEAPVTELAREQSAELSVGDVVDLAEPVGPRIVESVSDGAADLGVVHGDHGTLTQLENDGWTRPS